MMNIAQRQTGGKKLIASPEIELYFFVKWYVVSLKFVFLETLFYIVFTINVFDVFE